MIHWLIRSVCVALLVLFCGHAVHAADAPKPNVIFILADDLGYGELGCYGQKSIQTPNIDRLAVEGMRFTQFYAGSTVCSPSRAVLMTGQHTGHTFIRANDPRNLRPQDVIIPELLRKAGYTNGLVGKWGIGTEGSEGVPWKKGYDFFYGYLNNHHAHNHFPAFLWRNDAKEPLPNEQELSMPSGAGVASKKVVYSTDRFGEEAIGFVEQNKDKSFFLYLALTVPHANNEAKQQGMEVPDLGEYAAKDWPENAKRHAAMTTRMDAHVGRLMAKLKALEIDDRTLVIFTSDNGPHKEGGNDPEFHQVRGPVRGIKRDLTEGGIRVPFIARWPGRIAPGSTSNFVGGFQDVLPTLCTLAGVQAPVDIDGVDLSPTLLGKGEQKTPKYRYWEFHEGGFGQAVRMGDWKAIRTTRGKAAGKPAAVELYNLANDIGEANDVAAQHPDVVKQIEQIMAEARTPWEPLKEPAKNPAAGR
jgi:arylsulfatase A-like enzyme